MGWNTMSIWETIAAPIIAIINKVVPDKAAAAQAVATLNQMQLQGALQEEFAQLQAVTSAQSDVNKQEAASSSIFVAGWRPFCGWVCGGALALIYVVGPFFVWITALIGHPTPFPTLDSNQLMTLLFGMLGMGTLRTVDKVKGVSTKATG
jgi:hypothetical protein